MPGDGPFTLRRGFALQLGRERGDTGAGVDDQLLHLVQRPFAGGGLGESEGRGLDGQGAGGHVELGPGIATGGYGRTARRPVGAEEAVPDVRGEQPRCVPCLLYTSDAADD